MPLQMLKAHLQYGRYVLVSLMALEQLVDAVQVLYDRVQEFFIGVQILIVVLFFDDLQPGMDLVVVIIQSVNAVMELDVVVLNILIKENLALVDVLKEFFLLGADSMEDHEQLVLEIGLVCEVKRQSNHLDKRPLNHLININHLLSFPELLELCLGLLLLILIIRPSDLFNSIRQESKEISVITSRFLSISNLSQELLAIVLSEVIN